MGHRLPTGRPFSWEDSVALLDRSPAKLITHTLGFAVYGGGAPQRKDWWFINKTGADNDQVVDYDAMANLVGLGYAKEGTRAEDIKVTKLPIRVDSDDIEDFLDQAYRMRAQKPLLDKDGNPVIVNGKQKVETFIGCQGNGVEASRLQADGSWANIPCCNKPWHEATKTGFKDRPHPEFIAILRRQKRHDPTDGLRCPYAQNSDPKQGLKCTPESVLTCRCDAIGALGTFARYRSHSHHTADRLRATFEEIKAKLGFLTDVPLNLVLSKKVINTPRGRTGMQVVHVELRVTYDEALRLTERRLAMRAQLEDQRARLLLAAKEPDGEDRLAEFMHDRALPAPAAAKAVVHAEGNGVVAKGQATKPIEADVVDMPSQPSLVDVPPSKPYGPAVDGDR
jgi:hypothetical protein